MFWVVLNRSKATQNKRRLALTRQDGVPAMTQFWIVTDSFQSENRETDIEEGNDEN